MTRLRSLLQRTAVAPRRLVLVLRAPTSDVIVTSSVGELEAEFARQKSRVVFAADARPQPDDKLASKHPNTNGYRFLNSNGG